MQNCDVLIVAAGRGSRMGGPLPKQYLPVNGKPILRWTIDAFRQHKAVRRVCTVIAPEAEADYAEAIHGIADLPASVFGRKTRQGSVLAGLEALSADPPSFVAIQDGARPVVPLASFEAALAALASGTAAGAIVAVPLADSIKQVRDTAILGSVARDGLWRMQTPQVFRYRDILDAHQSCAPLAADERTALSDDAAVAEKAGLSLVVVPGTATNLKVTTPDDLAMAARLLGESTARMETRTGFGFDVHAFEPGSELFLCGVRIAHERRLAGHSDADVALHALTDAVLGAIAEADIGMHFPPSDPRWKGAASRQFLEHAVGLVRNRGGRIVHLDVTIICEAPRIGPHRDAMRARVAEMCGVDVARVSVKATTTERLGFTGRGEGIAAQAIANVELPA